MSKSTNRHGRILYSLHSAVTAFPQPTPLMLSQWKKLDKASIITYNKPYDALKHQEKVAIHFNITMGIYGDKLDAKISNDSRHAQPAQSS